MLFNKRMAPLTLVIFGILLSSCETRPDAKQQETDRKPSFNPYPDNAVSATPGHRSSLALDPSSSWTDLASGGAAQLSQLLMALNSYIRQFFPYLLKLKDSIPPGFRIPINSVLEYYNVTSIEAVSDQSLRYLSLDTRDCQLRGLCEVCSQIASFFPFAEGLLKQVAPYISLNPGNPFSKALFEGLTKQNCTETYVACPRSPLSLFKESFKALKL